MKFILNLIGEYEMAKQIKTGDDLAKIAGAELNAAKGESKKTTKKNKLLSITHKRKAGEISLVNRNKPGQPLTTEMDEWISGKPTGKIVVGHTITDGKYIPIYKEDEPTGEKPAKKKNSFFDMWLQDKLNDTSSDLDRPMTIDLKAVAAYNEWVRSGTQPTQANTVSEEPKGIKSKVFVLEFDWHYGHEKEEAKSRKDAVLRMAEWEKTFYHFEFENIQIYSEIRYRTKI